jgi:hypothetical protein
MDSKKYAGLNEDLKNGMTATAKIILDARLFGFIPADETCAGWTIQGIQSLYDKVSTAWDQYGHLPSRLPEDLKARHTEIYETAVNTAKAHGWNPDDYLGDED